MEVFRSDGSGVDHVNERLIVINQKIKQVDSTVFEKIESINDHKGDLKISLKDGVTQYDYEYIYSLFFVFWSLENECNVSIIVDHIYVYGYNKGEVSI